MRKLELLCMDKISNVFMVSIQYSNGIEYCVCRGYDFSDQTWDYSLGYFDEMEDAKKLFCEKIL